VDERVIHFSNDNRLEECIIIIIIIIIIVRERISLSATRIIAMFPYTNPLEINSRRLYSNNNNNNNNTCYLL